MLNHEKKKQSKIFVWKRLQTFGGLFIWFSLLKLYYQAFMMILNLNIQILMFRLLIGTNSCV